MRLRLVFAGVVAVVLSGALATSAFAVTIKELKRPSPSWYTPALHQRVLAAGAKGLAIPQESLNVACPGYAAKGVNAGGCIVFPFGCTANFVFTDGTSKYIGTARHCVDVGAKGGNDVGTPLVMQVDATHVAQVGTVVKHTSGTGDVGNDFALTKIDAAVAAKWGVNPAIPVWGGPFGVYTGCDVVAVKHYGHGYGVAVSQGYPRAGVATNWRGSGYGWTGHVAPGDSGSPVIRGARDAVGNLTHLIVDPLGFPGSDVAGMRMTAILSFLGSGYRLVDQGGGTSSATSSCSN